MDFKHLFIAGIIAGAAVSGFAGEAAFKMEKTPEAVRKYDRYNRKNADIVTVDGEAKLHVFAGGPVIVPLDPAKFAGKKIKWGAVFKCKNISAVPAGQNASVHGFKFFMSAHGNDGKYWGSQIGPFRGSCDWKAEERTTTVPENIKDLQIQIGIPGAKGEEAWVDELTVEIL